ncbi:MAG: efflux RND transporter periplasmic adaptor subunit [Magnetococcales bacterium]|nr:efflux RND transporter periplasmic adaptor subunit [Magnetococcales bacterium]
MGVRYGHAEPTIMSRTIRAFGMVMENERTETVIASKVDGWIEKLLVTAVGDEVRKGTVIYQLFSPELVAAQKDYLAAIESGNARRIASVAARLQALGVEERILGQLTKDKVVPDHVPFTAGADGVISKLNVRKGAYIKAGMVIASIQDYSKVWINASVAEKDLGMLHKDAPVEVILPNLPGRELKATIDYIHPIVDATSRTGTVRLVLDNADGMLRPGSYADVVFQVNQRSRLAVPSEALLWSKEGSHVIVGLGEGRFQPRHVTVGLSGGGFTEILSGLLPTDLIVLSGQFLIDSESSLKESFQKLQRLKTPLDALSLDGGQMNVLDHLVDAALYMHEAMVDGYEVKPDALATALAVKSLLWPVLGDTRLGGVLKEADKALNRAKEAKTQSQLLTALNLLVQALQPWILEGPVEHYQTLGIHVYREKQGERVWLQKGGKVFSPYGHEPGIEIPFAASHKVAVTTTSPGTDIPSGSAHDNH